MEGDVITSVSEVAMLYEQAVREIVCLPDIVPYCVVWESDNVEVNGAAPVLEVTAESCYSV
jgi:hypothetical protein